MAGSSSRIVRLLVLGTVSTMAFLTACGSSSSSGSEASKSAAQIFSDSRSATESASTVHIFGRVTSGGDTIGLDVVDSADRGGGTLTIEGVTVQLVLSGTTVYLKGSQATMTKLSDGNKVAGQVLGGKWLQTTTANKDYGTLADLLELPKLVQGFKPHGALRKGPVSTVDGRSVVALTDTSRKATLYVAARGRPYMVEIVGGPKEPGTITFDQFDSAKLPAIPTGAVSLGQLEGGSNLV